MGIDYLLDTFPAYVAISSIPLPNDDQKVSFQLAFQGVTVSSVHVECVVAKHSTAKELPQRRICHPEWITSSCWDNPEGAVVS